MQFFINGAWTPSQSTQRIAVTDPATGEWIDDVPAGNAADAACAIQAAQDAFALWRKTPMTRRVKLQHAAADALRARADEFALLLTRELGRPLAGSKTEIERSADLLDYYAEEGLRLRGEMPLLNEPDERVLVVQEPVGVVIAIAPFNYPITLLTFKLGAALITGCTVVAKPAEDTPLTTLKLAELFFQVGYPAGVFNVVTGYGNEIGHALVTHPTPRKIAFTGSTNAGKHIAALAAQTNKRVTLEMGGQSPAIVCADADLDTAIPAIVKHAYSNTGQFCYRVNRIYVHDSVYENFVARFCDAASKFQVGSGMNPSCQLGPLVNEKIFRNSVNQVKDALEKGARLLCGGARLSGDEFARGYFFPPTVLADTNHTMQIMTQETFGPVVGIMPFTSLQDALALANDSEYGLAAYVFSRDVGTAWRAAEQLEAGSVWVNNIHRSYNLVPFGGYKQSGLGREKSRHALDEYMEFKTIYLSF